MGDSGDKQLNCGTTSNVFGLIMLSKHFLKQRKACDDVLSPERTFTKRQVQTESARRRKR